MTYDNLDEIKLKLFEKIGRTGNLKLLTDENLSDKELQEIWQKMVDEFKSLLPNKEENKILKKTSKLMHYECEKAAITISITYLRQKYSQELADMLTGLGYKISKKNLQTDLDRIEAEIEGIDFLIKDIQDQLEAKTDQKEIRTDTIIAYYIRVLGIPIDSNEITVSQYVAYREIVEEEIKSRKKNGK